MLWYEPFFFLMLLFIETKINSLQKYLHVLYVYNLWSFFNGAKCIVALVYAAMIYCTLHVAHGIQRYFQTSLHTRALV